VHETGVVCGAQRRSHRLEDVEGFSHAQPPPFPQQVPERAARDVLHREEHVSGIGALVVDRDDVGVREASSGAGLADEAGDELFVLRETRMHHLEGNLAVQAAVEGKVDRCHPAASEP
jgi:hypothetical protein